MQQSKEKINVVESYVWTTVLGFSCRKNPNR